MKKFYLTLFLFTLLFLPTVWASRRTQPAQEPQVSARVIQQQQMAARRRSAFSKGRELLARKGVPFDPDELLDSRLKERLRPIFDQMPELRLAQQGETKINGAVMAHTLYLPDKIQLDGDTVILARRLVFLGRDVVIKGNHDIHIFTIEDAEFVDTQLAARAANKTKFRGRAHNIDTRL